MRKKKNNIQRIDTTANIITAVIVIITSLVLFGSCSVFLFSDTGNSVNNTTNIYKSSYSNYSYNNTDTTNSYTNNVVNNTATNEVENKAETNNVVTNTTETKSDSITSKSSSYKSDSSSSSSSYASAYEDDSSNSNKSTSSSSTSSSSKSTSSSASSSYSRGYVLNTNTKKFHYSGCSSVSKMKDKNKRYSSEPRDEIISQGYSPCQRCNP